MSKSRTELEEPFVVTDNAGRTSTVSLTCAWAQQTLASERDGWCNYLTNIQLLVKQGKLLRNKIPSHIEEGLTAMLSGDVQQMQKLEPMSKMLIRYAMLATNLKNPLNPSTEQRRGDWFDFSMLLALALPNTIIFTRDGRFKNALSEAGSTQVHRIVLLDEFIERLEKGMLGELIAA